MSWLRRLLAPHLIIGSKEAPYMLRWYLIPRNRFFNVYLHKFCKDDDDRALHDHPWWFVSILIRGRYTETITVDPTEFETDITRIIHRESPSIAFRKATHRHRVVLPLMIDVDPETDKFVYKSRPAWTIVITGSRVRTWGFWCPKGFVPWHEFVDRDNEGAVGRGCGDG